MPIDIFRFSFIFLCFLLSFRQGLPLAAFLTLCADFFLIFTKEYAVGISIFLFAHLAYLQNLKGKPLPWATFLFLPLLFCLHLVFLGICYAVLFSFHIKEAIKKVQRETCPKLYLLGLILFVCCDIAVVWGYFHTPVPWLIWLFYAPSQLLLALTAKFKPIP